MAARPLDYLAEWLHLALEDEDGVDHWQAHFDEVRVAWQLDRARGLLREAKRAALSQRGLAIVRHSEGMLYAQLGDWDQALHCLMRSVNLLEDSQYVEEGILILNDLGMLLRLQGNHRGAEAAHRQALSLADEMNQPYLTAEALEHLGLDLEHRDQVTEAIEHFRRALAQREALNDEDGLASTLNHLGEALWRQGDLSGARDALQRASEILREAGDAKTYLSAQVQGNLGNVCYAEDNLAGAESYWQSALATCSALGAVYDQVGLLNNLGGLALQRDEYVAALDRFRQSLALARDLGDQRGIVEALTNLGMALTHTHDWTGAVDCYRQVLAMDIGSRYGAMIRGRLARLYVLIALDRLRQAILGEVAS
jgi:tetratricopeptide (TPR) repeat protein